MHASERYTPFQKRFSPFLPFAALAVLTSAVAFIASGCSGNSVTTPASTSSAMAAATVRLSDPATCMAPNGPFAHVYVTVTDVKASVNATAADNDSSFVDLTPGLTSPKQIDLLGPASDQCFLASLGSTQQLQPGNYQQIRVILADHTAPIANNACVSSANCVVLADGSIHTLLLSSESKTGIKIPVGQIANGGFSVGAGQTKDLDIDFNTCVSIIQQGNGQYRLKPVLHAGEVTTTSSSINGSVVDSVTGKPVNGQVLVALEQRDSSGIDRVFMSTLTDVNGQFVFCPLPAGSYDVVIVGESSTGIFYAPTIITATPSGSALATIQLHAQPATAVGPATLQGVVTAQNTASPPAGIGIDVQVSALEPVSASLIVTIPLPPNATQSSAAVALATAAASSCPSGTDCASYRLLLPATSPWIGAYAATGSTLAISAIAPAYTIDGIASVPSSGGVPDCSAAELKSNPVTPGAGITATVSTLAFTGCS